MKAKTTATTTNLAFSIWMTHTIKLQI